MGEWVRTSDDLPRDGEDVLVYLAYSHRFAVGSYTSATTDWWCRSELIEGREHVSHWRPLPLPPEPKLTVKEALSLAVCQLSTLQKTGFTKSDGTYVIGGEIAKGAFTDLLPRLRAALESEE